MQYRQLFYTLFTDDNGCTRSVIPLLSSVRRKAKETEETPDSLKNMLDFSTREARKNLGAVYACTAGDILLLRMQLGGTQSVIESKIIIVLTWGPKSVYWGRELWPQCECDKGESEKLSKTEAITTATARRRHSTEITLKNMGWKIGINFEWGISVHV